MDDDRRSISTLICREDTADLESCGDSGANHLSARRARRPVAVLTDDDEGYIEILLSRDTDQHKRVDSDEAAPDEWLAVARRDAVRWMLQKQASFGFEHRTALLAVDYFDRFCCRRSIDKQRPWAAKLLAIACVSLAAKMEELSPPPLPELTGDFDVHSVQRMELLVLSTLDWRMCAVTPLDFIGPFAGRLADMGSDYLDALLAKTAALILAAVLAGSIRDYKPSTVAAAALIAASKESAPETTAILLNDHKDLLHLQQTLSQEQLVRDCCAALFGDRRRKIEPPGSSASDGSSCVIDVDSISGGGDKRRRLQ